MSSPRGRVRAFTSSGMNWMFISLFIIKSNDIFALEVGILALSKGLKQLYSAWLLYNYPLELGDMGDEKSSQEWRLMAKKFDRGSIGLGVASGVTGLAALLVAVFTGISAGVIPLAFAAHFFAWLSTGAKLSVRMQVHDQELAQHYQAYRDQPGNQDLKRDEIRALPNYQKFKEPSYNPIPSSHAKTFWRTITNATLIFAAAEVLAQSNNIQMLVLMGYIGFERSLMTLFRARCPNPENVPQGCAAKLSQTSKFFAIGTGIAATATVAMAAANLNGAAKAASAALTCAFSWFSKESSQQANKFPAAQESQSLLSAPAAQP